MSCAHLGCDVPTTLLPLFAADPSTSLLVLPCQHPAHIVTEALLPPQATSPLTQICIPGSIDAHSHETMQCCTARAAVVVATPQTTQSTRPNWQCNHTIRTAQHSTSQRSTMQCNAPTHCGRLHLLPDSTYTLHCSVRLPHNNIASTRPQSACSSQSEVHSMQHTAKFRV